jgi:hypothetical protein
MKRIFTLLLIVGFLGLIAKEIPDLIRELKIERM